jgi:alpha-tubulin suppressor-like RCC1 family protein
MLCSTLSPKHSPNQEFPTMRRSVFVQLALVTGVTVVAGCGSSGSVQPLPSALTAIAVGAVHTCGLVQDGSAFCWGNNQFGEIGDGSHSDRYFPVAVAGTVKFTEITAGGGHTCGISTNGAAYCWGSNGNGQLGDGTLTDRATPAPVAGGLTFLALSAGGVHTCGIASDNTAYCWGYNGNGQLGDSTFNNRSLPTPVVGGQQFVAISAGKASHSCAVTASGQAFCWGANDYGELGTGDQTKRPAPVAVEGGLVFQTIHAGYAHTCGLTVDGTAYCWGRNFYGQLGTGDQVVGQDQSMPTAVTGGLKWALLRVGAYFTCGLEQGTSAAYCWGYNSSGQLGVDVSGVCTDQNGIASQCAGSPSAVSGGLAFTALDASTQHTCALTQGGVAYCWGADSYGQLGDGQHGATIFLNAPVKVLGQP